MFTFLVTFTSDRLAAGRRKKIIMAMERSTIFDTSLSLHVFFIYINIKGVSPISEVQPCFICANFQIKNKNEIFVESLSLTHPCLKFATLTRLQQGTTRAQ